LALILTVLLLTLLLSTDPAWLNALFLVGIIVTVVGIVQKIRRRG
jgi:hypothetical protein